MNSKERELVVAPVTITPTKPLTPTHIKCLLWTDVLLKATAQLMPTRLVWSPRLANLTTQTTAFWDYLDRVEPDTDWANETEDALGARYVDFHRNRGPADPRALDGYFARIERDGWVHPAARRLLGHWRVELDRLGVADPGLTVDRPLRWSSSDVFAALAERRLLVDHRRFGGPAYLDGTRWGSPIRRVAADGHDNYLIPILRALLPMIRPDRVFLLLYDEELDLDFLMLARVLTVCGAVVRRLPLSRVSIDGVVKSSRHGGWTGYTLHDIATNCSVVNEAAYRLGMRLYFVGTLHRRSPQSFRMDLLHRSIGRAARILAKDPAAGAGPGLAALAASLHPNSYVDPYRLTTSLLGRRAPLVPALREVYT